MNKNFQMWLKKDNTISWKQRHAFTWPRCAEAKYIKH